MAPTQPKSPSGASDASPPPANGSAPSTNPNKMRKRTKTGCLTCRKRRIKCGEERPICGNCIKSKRQCEGYNQRVIFKPPIGDWPNHPGAVSTIQYHTSMLPGSRSQSVSQPAASVKDHSPTSSHPRPAANYVFSSVDTGNQTASAVQVAATSSYSPEQSYQQPLSSPPFEQPLHSPHHQVHISTSASTASYFPQTSPLHTSFQTQYIPSSDNFQTPHPYTQDQPPYQQVPVSYDAFVDPKPAIPQPMSEQPVYEGHHSFVHPLDQASYLPHLDPALRSDQYFQFPRHRPVMQRYSSDSEVALYPSQINLASMSTVGSYNFPAAVSHANFAHSNFHTVQIPTHDMIPDVKYMRQPVLEQSSDAFQVHQSGPEMYLSGFAGANHVSPTQVLDEAAVEYEDDDYWDVQSDEEMADQEDGVTDDTTLASKDFEIIRRIHFENSNDLSVRRYDDFLYEGLLSHYKPEYAASPLRNPKTARVFAHFIHVTGPSLSIYERNPRNSALLFEGPTPAAQQGLWTYILPLKALNNQGLLHAMLALASIHIARLQGASITPSYKHYAYSLKRLGRALGNSKKRLSISTLATSLLLAYYEVWTAEHTKWSTHVVGAAQLIRELGFRSLTREARRLKAAQIAEERQFPSQNPQMLIDHKQFNQRLWDSAIMPDEGLVSSIVGKEISYDGFGMILEEDGTREDNTTHLPGGLDLRSYETLEDLYWWYARQDTFQSIVSGNPLIMAYRHWSDCPPRAPLGRADALFGSHDHIMLLLGRIAQFTARDRARKLRQVDADGGQWRPRPDMPGFGSMGPPPGKGRSQSPIPGMPNTPAGPPQMPGPPPGWKGGPPPGWKGGPPPGDPSTPKETPSDGPPPSAMPTFFGMAPSRPIAPLSSGYANPNHQYSPPTPNTPHPKFSDLPAAYKAALEEWDNISAAHTAVSQVLTNAESFAALPPELCVIPPGSTSTMTPFGPALTHRSYDISIIWMLLHLSKIILLRSHPAMPPAAMMAAGVSAPVTQPYATLIGRIAAGMQLPLNDNLSPFLGAVLTESTMPLFFAAIQYQDAAQREWTITRLLEVDRRTGWASAGVIARGCETAWEKVAALGRGPPYNRRTRRAFEEGPLLRDDHGTGAGVGASPPPPNWRNKEANAVGKGLRGGDSEAGEYMGAEDIGVGADGKSKEFVMRSRPAPWAMNLLG